MDGKKTIKLVDGFAIRNTLDDEFGLIHFHGDLLSYPFAKRYIPKEEVWVDHTVKDEAEFLLHVESETDKYIERDDTDYRAFAKSLCLQGPTPHFIVKEEAQKDLTIQYVDGGIVRSYIDPYFVLGGHDLVYSYISSNTVWLDVKMDPRELPYIKLHEVAERELMEQGKLYEDAHRFAAAADMEARRKDGVGSYPDDEDYRFRNKEDEELIKTFYV